MNFDQRASDYVARVERALDDWLPGEQTEPARLHAAMRHAVFNGGKRLRPLLAYATGEVLNIGPEQIDEIAVAVELIHCYSLVHDDLPAMDDDDLRRGLPTVHKAFDEGTAILVGDGLQALAFECLGASLHPGSQQAILLLARACGSDGMVAGQALDLQFERQSPDRDQLEQMFSKKTGALLAAPVLMVAARLENLQSSNLAALNRYARALGVAFQIKDDLLEVEGDTATIGKSADSDVARHKATWPGLFGREAAHRRLDELIAEIDQALAGVSGNPQALAWLAQRIVQRNH